MNCCWSTNALAVLKTLSLGGSPSLTAAVAGKSLPSTIEKFP